jgi:AcrR family transcriptional regulator
MWVSKEGDVRKQEFLSTAFEIFCEKGYDNTSINDIIEKVGVTKGAFYYYFKSKEDILQILADSQVETVLKITRQIAGSTELNAVEKINLLIEKTHEFRNKNIGDRLLLYKLLENESNARLVRKISEEIIKRGKPEMLRIIEQGIDEGLFDVRFPAEAAEFILQFSIILNSQIQNIMIQKDNNINKKNTALEKLSFYEEVLIKILGITKTNLNLAQKLISRYSLD